MIDVYVPRENVNDDDTIVISVLHPSGSRVRAGDDIFEIETTKTNVVIAAPADGILLHDIAVGDALRVGAVLCRIDDGKEAASPDAGRQTRPAAVDAAADAAVVISKPARKRAAELGVDLAAFTSGMISVADVEKLAGSAAQAPREPTVQPLPTAQRAASPFPGRQGNRLVVLGGGRHAKMCIDILRQRNEFQVVGIVDSVKPVGTRVCGIEVIGDNAMLEQLWDDGVTYAINAVGSVDKPGIRKELFERLKRIGYLVPNLVHPSAVIEPSAILGEGNQVMMGACVGSDAVIGDNCIVNSGAIVSHDSVISSHAHIAPGAILAGGVQIGEGATVGMGVTIYMDVSIGANALVNNGVDVFRDIAAATIAKD